MKTLYVSDLDGTLMQPDCRISRQGVKMLNEAIASGKLFTIATARTPATVADILKDVDMCIPAVVMTGAALWNPNTKKYSNVRYFDADSVAKLIEIYRDTQTPTFLFTLRNDMLDIYHFGGEMFPLQQKFMEERLHSPHKTFHISRNGSELLPDDLSKTVLFYTMLPDRKAADVFAMTSEVKGVRPQYYHDIYGPEIGILEAFSENATKAKAVRALADSLGVDRIVCFGDNINDLPMMAEADIAVAVENALPEVKEAADIVIGPNTSDAVAKFILDHD